MDVLTAARYQEIADLHLQARNFDQAAEILRHLLGQDRNNPVVLYRLGVLALETGQPGEAVRYLQRAAKYAPRDPDLLFAHGRALKASGRIEHAVQAYRKALRLSPDRADWHVSLGIALRALKRSEEAIAAYRKAIALRPDYAEAHHNLGNLLAAGGDREQAEARYRRALDLSPTFADAHFELGNLAAFRSDRSAARAAYQAALAARPKHVQALLALARIEHALGNEAEGWAAVERAVEAEPRNAEAQYEYAKVLRSRQERSASIEALKRSLEAEPDRPDVLTALAELLEETGELGDAAACLDRAIQLEPKVVQRHVSLGNILNVVGELDSAIAAYRKAIALDPVSVTAHVNLGSAYKGSGQVAKAEEHYKRAIALDPGFEPGFSHLGALYVETGEQEKGIAMMQEAVGRNPGAYGLRSNLCMSMNYLEANDCVGLLAEHRQVGRDIAAAAPRGPAVRADRDPQRRLRIGYLSPDFRRHSVAHFIEPVLARHERSRFEVFAYHNHVVRDEYTQRMQALCDGWRHTVGLSDETLAERIRTDGIDLLVDLAGHTSDGRLLTLARKPAPLQFTWLGYVTTTGLEAVDYRITDHFVDPPGYETVQTETPLRLPGCHLCFRTYADAPPVVAPPAGDSAPVTFGSFNNLTKVGCRTIDLWSQVMRAVPRSRLLIKTRILADETVGRRLLQHFEARGIETARIELLPFEREIGHHLGTYNRVDIGLDTFPYNGVTTTCEAMWMGVPVVSLAGVTHASRLGLTLLNAVGLTELAATDEAGFVATAVALATDRTRLASLRAGLRERMAASALMDEEGFTRRLEDAYRGAWQRWCEAE